MFSEYIASLYIQYCNSIGKIINLEELYNLPEEFIDWIYRTMQIKDRYDDYIEYLGVDTKRKDVQEVDKGIYDSIKHEEKKLILLDDTPIITTPKIIIPPKEIKILLTHNPYQEKMIEDWYKVHNKGIHDICIGVYGKNYDKDKKDKIEMLHKLFEKMSDDSIESYDEDGDNYFYNIKSQRISKKRILIR